MRLKFALAVTAAALVLGLTPASVRAGEMVSLAEHGSLTEAYLALPDNAPYGAVLLIHDKWGLSRFTREYADEWARKGFVALAIDLYDGERPSTPQGAVEYTKRVSIEGATQLVRVGLKYLCEDPKVRSQRISVVGYGIGARWALVACTTVPGLNACCLVDGPLENSPELIRRVSAPVLGIFPRHGSTMPESKVRELANSLNGFGKPAEIYLFNESPGFFNSERSGGELTRRARVMVYEFVVRQLRQPLAAKIPPFKEDAVKRRIVPFLPIYR